MISHMIEEEKQKELLFLNQTKLTSETYINVIYRLSRKKMIFVLLMGIFITIISLFLLLLDVLYFKKEDWVIEWILFIIGPTFIIYFFFFKKIIKKRIEKNLKGKTAIIDYNFYQDDFDFIGRADNNGMINTSRVSGDYSKFISCRELDDCWLLYYSKTDLEIIEKDGMINGDVSGLSKFLKEKLNSNYKICFKKK